jgi:hypothetical protein
MLTKAVSDLEDEEKTSKEILDWVNQQSALVNEMKSKPLKLRADANTSDLTSLQSIIDLIADKKEELFASSGAVNPEFVKRLNAVDELVRLKHF